MDIEKLLINKNIINQIENDQKISLINPMIDIEENQKQKMIDMLQTILKNKFDSKLNILEKNSKNHFSIINKTLTTTKYITDLSIKLQKGIRQKKLQEKRSKFAKISKSTKKLQVQSRAFTSKFSENISKTPNHCITNRNTFRNNSRIKNYSLLQRMRNDSKIKSPIFRMYTEKRERKVAFEEKLSKSPISPRDYQLTSYRKEKNNINKSSINKTLSYKKNASSNVKKNNIRINSVMENIAKGSVMSNDTNKSFITSESSKSSMFLTTKKNNNLTTSKNKNLKSPLKKSFGLIGTKKKNLDKNSPYKKRNSIKKRNKKEKTFNDNSSNEAIISNINNRRKFNRNKELLSDKNNIALIDFNSKYSIESNINNDKIITLESNLKKEANLINNDPLLISSLKDLEFVPKVMLSNNISCDENNNDNNNKVVNMKSINNYVKEKHIFFKKELSIFKEENYFFDENLNNILVFLYKKDILVLKNCSKSFHKLVIDYLVKQLDIERNYFITIQNELNINIEDIPPKLSINDLQLSKGALKAINLLNEEILNRLFIEDKPPNKEILIIYKIYFQLIKYEEIIKSFNSLDNNIFWEKCKLYFREKGGKTGSLLNSIVSNKEIYIDGDNLYQIYKLTQNNINKIYPAYYSKICGTTGLFVFFIKDILDFLGFSNDKKLQKNAYWNYSEIINMLDSKINKLNTFQIE